MPRPFLAFVRPAVAPLFLLIVIGCHASASDIEGRVVGVSDGDTLTLRASNETYRVRLSEIDAPEKGQPWGDRSKRALSSKAHQKNVRVAVVDTDRYGRIVGVIYTDNRNLNREMVAEGHAWVYRRYLRDQSLLELEKVAKHEKLGLWGVSKAPIPPWEWREQERNRKVPAQRTGDCNIKGNISSKGAKIYHMPGQEHYQQTRINVSKGERWFCSEAEARSSGWRKARK